MLGLREKGDFICIDGSAYICFLFDVGRWTFDVGRSIMP